MFTTVYVAGRRVRLDPSDAINSGGEADIYKFEQGVLLKVLKSPDHSDYLAIADPEERHRAIEGARIRIAEYQEKMPAFPRSLPKKVVGPIELARTQADQIVGMTMQFVQNAEVIRQLADKDFRLRGVPNQKVVVVFLDLHGLVSDVHKARVVIGDFNDLNVLIAGLRSAYLIDADSMSFGRWLCKSFTTTFVDPLRCDPRLPGLLLNQPHTPESDWYAFCVMLFQSLLFTGPYGGVYMPKYKSQKVLHDARPLHRISVFHPDVKYPKPAQPMKMLSDDLLGYFEQVFVKDERGEFPIVLLQTLRFTKCTNCGFEHARAVCPQCTHAAPAAVKEKVTVRGTVTATRVFRTDGMIVYAAFQGGQLRWIEHDDKQFKREDGNVVIGGDLDAQMRFRICGNRTVIAKNGKMVTFADSGHESIEVDTYATSGLPVLDANQKYRYWTYNGQLLRDGQFGPEFIGNVLSGQTLFWVGPAFGFGFYRAGGLNVAFVFDAERQGINDNVQIPPIVGQLVDSTCFFTKDFCWFLVSYRDGGKTTNQCTVIRSDGTAVATAKASDGDGSWLGTLRGKVALGNGLLSATDAGIVRVEQDQGNLKVTKEFPDTEPWIDTSVHLFPSPQGLYVVSRKEVNQLVIK